MIICNNLLIHPLFVSSFILPSTPSNWWSKRVRERGREGWRQNARNRKSNKGKGRGKRAERRGLCVVVDIPVICGAQYETGNTRNAGRGREGERYR